MSKDEQIKKAIQLSNQILLFSRDNLLVSLRFLDAALSQFKLVHSLESESIGMNGQDVLYHYRYILKQYKIEKEFITRTYLHMVFHCIFFHPFKGDKLREDYWNLATDMATENAILELNIKAVQTTRDDEQQAIIHYLKNKLKMITAEKLYRYFLEDPLSTAQVEKYSELFKRDHHEFWRKSSHNGYIADDHKSESSNANSENNENSSINIFDPEILEKWERISERVKIDLETFSKEHGAVAGGLMQNIREANRDHYDYGEFLKRFAVLGEDIQINEDEFDYAFYTYGMKLYGKMPLIEPLEYKEDYKIKDFVIAIDTSGSCSGEVVQAFLNKTYSIMKSTESFFRKVNIHIIQCDAKIQSDTKITSDEEFEEFINNVKLKGFGGTDFRPVFHYVEDLIEKGEFDHLNGLIYFTDGYGKFPEWMPKYDVAFVFIDEYDQPKVPVWAMKLVLLKEDIIE